MEHTTGKKKMTHFDILIESFKSEQLPLPVSLPPLPHMLTIHQYHHKTQNHEHF